MRTPISAVIFVAALLTANWLVQRSWGGTVYVYVGERRAPAAVRSLRDYSAVDRRALYRSVHAQLMASAQTLRRDGQVGVRLGHPLVPVEEGARDFACRASGRAGIYDRVVLTFYGTGITDSGEPPHIVVDSECRASAQLDALDTIWIPMRELVKGGTADRELLAEGERPARIQISHIPDVWPENWVLWSVRFYRSEAEGSDLTVDAERLKQAVSALVSFDFKPER